MEKKEEPEKQEEIIPEPEKEAAKQAEEKSEEPKKDENIQDPASNQAAIDKEAEFERMRLEYEEKLAKREAELAEKEAELERQKSAMVSGVQQEQQDMKKVSLCNFYSLEVFLMRILVNGQRKKEMWSQSYIC